MNSSKIKVTGARIHNLKNINIEIPKGKLTVITGVSGSGKSSFAFDTLYEEGKRRYLMFSDTNFMVDNVPTFDSLTGLSPTVAVEQRITRQSNPRSTVGTRTKLNAMMSALFAAYGKRDTDYNDEPPLSMEMFQKNSPRGMCVRCLGNGKIYTVDEDDLFGDKSGSLRINIDRGIKPHYNGRINEFCQYHHLSPEQAIDSLSEEDFTKYKYGDGGKTRFEGMIPWIINHYKWRIRMKGWNPSEITCVSLTNCPKCNGTGLNEYAIYTTINGKSIAQLEDMYISDLYEFLKKDRWGYASCAVKRSGFSDTKLLDEILIKLDCMIDVGLHHLSLSRPVPTLSGGEIQRLFLASYIIAEIDSIIFVFDEPTIGLHEVEKQKLLNILQNVLKRGNTVIAVEHDENFMQAADYIVDLGPFAGEYGGERIFQGSYTDFLTCEKSLTSPYLSGKLSLPVKTTYKRIDTAKTLRLSNCNIHNLRGLSVEVPLGLLVGVAGVSGSGKSSLISDTLVPKLKEVLKSRFVEYEESYEAVDRAAERYLKTSVHPDVQITGIESIKKCLIIDQKPIGRSRTSCPATYTGIFDRVRKMFSETPESIAQGFSPGMFSANSEGKCKTCNGEGVRHYHVGFGNFIDVDCEMCGSTGFTPESMTIAVGGKNIKDILDMSITNAMDYFKDKNKASYRMLKTLDRVGLGYMSLGQKTPTISGGEAQRIKLAKELGRSGNGKNNMYILDEPTTGLSFSDSVKLIQLIQELVDSGNTVIITEHDPSILSNCDYIIEMGPGGGSDGGYVIATGTPAEVKENEASIIGRFLK